MIKPNNGKIRTKRTHKTFEPTEDLPWTILMTAQISAMRINKPMIPVMTYSPFDFDADARKLPFQPGIVEPFHLPEAKRDFACSRLSCINVSSGHY
jgi:hypothetical protein